MAPVFYHCSHPTKVACSRKKKGEKKRGTKTCLTLISPETTENNDKLDEKDRVSTMSSHNS